MERAAIAREIQIMNAFSLSSSFVVVLVLVLVSVGVDLVPVASVTFVVVLFGSNARRKSCSKISGTMGNVNVHLLVQFPETAMVAAHDARKNWKLCVEEHAMYVHVESATISAAT
jgi:hypothetical protein